MIEAVSRKSKYGVLEIEAHYFAAEFLMPTAILKYFPAIEIDEIVLLFGVSEEAAKKKYNRVFKTSYMPSSTYDELLVRNFYNFLANGIDAAIYKNIYGQWGLPNKAKYVPYCRKCPECLTYISDQSAVYCSHCGAEIDKKKVYSKMYDRLRDQQRFAKLPGYSHPMLPSISVDLSDGSQVTHLRFCPNCLNHDVDLNSAFCKICGSPLYNICSNCGKQLEVHERHCSKCGAESTFHDLYEVVENRINRINDCSTQKQFSEDWFEYPYWGYVTLRLSAKGNPDLATALLYSKAYVDDENGFIIYTDSLFAAKTIYDNWKIILDFAQKTDKIIYARLEVYLFQ